jgi:hypothetical protein
MDITLTEEWTITRPRSDVLRAPQRGVQAQGKEEVAGQPITEAIAPGEA